MSSNELSETYIVSDKTSNGSSNGNSPIETEIVEHTEIIKVGDNNQTIIFRNECIPKYQDQISQEDRILIEEMKNLRLYDPKIDNIFKIIFGEINNKEIAISLLNSIIYSENEYVDDIHIGNTELITIPYDKDNKKVIVDIYITDLKKKKHFLLEMQIKEKDDIILRAEFALSLLINNDISVGKKFIISKDLYSIVFLYYDISKNEEYFHKFSNNVILNIDEERKSHVKEEYFIELNKFERQFNIEELKELKRAVDENKKNNIEDKFLEYKLTRLLWFAFLSKINTDYIKEDNNQLISESTIDNKLRESKKYKIIECNKIDLELYKLLKSDKNIAAALNICNSIVNKTVKENFVNYVSKATWQYEESVERNRKYYENKLKEKLKEKDEENEQKLKEKDKENEFLKNMLKRICDDSNQDYEEMYNKFKKIKEK